MKPFYKATYLKASQCATALKVRYSDMIRFEIASIQLEETDGWKGSKSRKMGGYGFSETLFRDLEGCYC